MAVGEGGQFFGKWCCAGWTIGREGYMLFFLHSLSEEMCCLLLTICGEIVGGQFLFLGGWGLAGT